MKKLSILALILLLLSCGDNAVNISGAEDPYSSGDFNSSSGGSSTTPQTANAVILTLTYWHTTDTDIGGLDPKIYFRVTAYVNKKVASNYTSDVLLDAQDIPATWTGSRKSSPVPFVPQADSLFIRAVVLEKDTFSDDDISPGMIDYWKSVPSNGYSGSSILDYGKGKSKVGYQYEFIRQ